VSSAPGSAKVTVAIPVRDGGSLFAGVLRALAAQTVPHELLVCDSGSTDGSLQTAREHGARVIEIAPERFNHGTTRNLLLGEAAGEHVALLSQDAEPADERWLERLLEGFELADDVGLVYGPYRPRPDAAAPVRMELERWFKLLAPGGQPRVDRLDPSERASLPAAALIGPRGFFTDANACIARQLWREVPFREVSCAEDRALAVDMLRAGHAKVFVPAAAVVHSHTYGTRDELRRAFDEWRGLREVYGWREPASPPQLLRRLRGELGHARRTLAAERAGPLQRYATLAAVSRHNVARLAGAVLGSRAERLPARARRALSLERRAGFQPLATGAGARSQPRT